MLRDGTGMLFCEGKKRVRILPSASKFENSGHVCFKVGFEMTRRVVTKAALAARHLPCGSNTEIQSPLPVVERVTCRASLRHLQRRKLPTIAESIAWHVHLPLPCAGLYGYL